MNGEDFMDCHMAVGSCSDSLEPFIYLKVIAFSTLIQLLTFLIAASSQYVVRESNPCLETMIDTNTTKRYTHYYDINATDRTENSFGRNSSKKFTNHNGAQYNRHRRDYYCYFDEDQGEEYT